MRRSAGWGRCGRGEASGGRSLGKEKQKPGNIYVSADSDEKLEQDTKKQHNL